MGLKLIKFVLHVLTHLQYHLNQEFQKCIVKFGFYSFCKKENMQVLMQILTKSIRVLFFFDNEIFFPMSYVCLISLTMHFQNIKTELIKNTLTLPLIGHAVISRPPPSPTY